MFTKRLFNGFLLLALCVLLGVTWRHFYRPVVPEPHLHIAVQSWKQPDGFEVFLLEDHTIPMVDIALGFRAGASYDGQDPGLASATAALVDKGTKTKSASDITERLAEIAAQFSSGVDEDTSWFRLRTMTQSQYHDPALALFQELVTGPSFPQARLEEYKQNLQSYFLDSQEKPLYHASLLFKKALFGQGAYAGDLAGTPKSVKQLTRYDLQRFARQYYLASHAALVIVGDYSSAQAEQLAEQFAEALPQGTLQPVALMEQAVQADHIEKKFPSTQTAVMMGMRLDLEATDPDYFPLLVGNEVLGAPSNALASELANEVREKRGLVYYVVSQFATDPGTFTIRFLSQNEKVDEAINVTRETLGRFLAKPIEPRVLEAAKLAMMRKYLVSNSTNKSLLRRLTGLWSEHLSPEWINTRNPKIAAVTPEQVQAAWGRHIRLNKMTLVRVGDHAKS